jgi:hypothetical protein
MKTQYMPQSTEKIAQSFLGGSLTSKSQVVLGLLKVFKAPLTSGLKRNFRSVVVPDEAQCAGIPGLSLKKLPIFDL